MAQTHPGRIADSVAQARRIGQSLWQDELDRPMIESGRLAELLERGISGVTTNPAIFGKALAGSDAYDADLAAAARERRGPDVIWDLLVEDVRRACDVLSPVYTTSNGADGFVSIEVDPGLAHDTEATLAMALSLWERVGKPNVMVKIPGTAAGLSAIRQAIARGVNVNVTLIFGAGRYREVVEAYMSGLEDRVRQNLPVTGIGSVASFFVSRVDTRVDKRLEQLAQNDRGAEALRGRAAIANSKLAYESWLELFSSARWGALKARGARPQRCLWASTSTKNPAYKDTKYAEALIGPETVDTLPPATFEAFADHGVATPSLTADLDRAHQDVAALARFGIDLEEVARELEVEGVESFAKAWDEAQALVRRKLDDAIVDVASDDSFPASDPPPFNASHG